MGRQCCQGSSELFSYRVDRLQTVDDVEQPPRPVEFGNRRGLLAIDVQSGLEDLGIVVAAHRLASAGCFLSTAANAIEKCVFVDLELEDRVKLDTPGGKLLIERLGLRDRTGKSVEDEAVRS